MSDTKSNPSGSLPWKRMLLTTDFSDASLLAWDHAKALAAAGLSECVALHVTEPAYEGLRIHTESLHEKMKQAAESKLAGLVKDRLGQGISVNSMVEEGRPASVICEVAAKAGVDLIVISSHGRSGLKHILLGSVAEHVVRHAPCAVLVLPIGQR